MASKLQIAGRVLKYYVMITSACTASRIGYLSFRDEKAMQDRHIYKKNVKNLVERTVLGATQGIILGPFLAPVVVYFQLKTRKFNDFEFQKYKNAFERQRVHENRK